MTWNPFTLLHSNELKSHGNMLGLVKGPQLTSFTTGSSSTSLLSFTSILVCQSTYKVAPHPKVTSTFQQALQDVSTRL